MIDINCEQCGKTVPKYPYEIKKSKHHFCSPKCGHEYRKSPIPIKERKAAYDKQYYKDNRERLIAYQKEYGPKWKKKNPKAHKEIQLRHRRKARHEALMAYGGKCACCGLDNEPFLSIDHINNDGAEHRKITGGAGYHIYVWLRVNKYPPGFQVLCYNCNLAKQHYGICPHQTRPSS